MSVVQVGDYVIYRFNGSEIGVPFELKKEAVERRGDHVVIDVIASRADERRHWIEVVPDTQRDLGNLDQLHDWMPALPGDVVPGDGTESVFLEGSSFECNRSFGETTWNGAAVKVKSLACDEFPWGQWEYAIWDDAKTIANIEVIETGSGGYSQVAWPAGTTPTRVKDFSSIEEACTRSDGARDGPWSKRDGHGKPLVVGEYRAGKKQGLWKDNEFGLLEEHCMFVDGDEVGFVRPWEWTHLRLALAGGGGAGLGAKGGASAVAQVGWDLWTPARRCRLAEVRKSTKSTGLAAIGDVHLFVPDGSPTTILRLGLQGHLVPAEPRRGYLDTGLFDTGYLASIGVIVSPTLGIGASLGIDLLFGIRIETHYDYLPGTGQLVTLDMGLSDGFLAAFN